MKISHNVVAPATGSTAVGASWRSTNEQVGPKAAARDADEARKGSGSRKHWMLRGYMPQEQDPSTQDLQHLLGEKLQGDDAMASQLRAIVAFEVSLYERARRSEPIGKGAPHTGPPGGSGVGFDRHALPGLGFNQTRRLYLRCRGQQNWEKHLTEL